MSDDVQCPMPRAVFLERHIVRDSNSWPPPAAGIIRDLSAAVSAVTNMDLTGHEPVLEAARHGHLLVQDRLRVEAKIPYIAPESKRTVLVPLVGNILRSIMPNIDQNLNASYARAVHPCCSDYTAVRLLPRSGVAASVITLPICLDESTHEEPETPVRQTEKPVEEDYLMQDAEEHTSDGASTTTSDSTTYQDSSDAASASNDFYDIDPSVRVDDRHPYYHAHLLVPHRPHNAIPFPLVCIAARDEIYEVLSSALLQRRTVGINGPLLGFTFNPLACHLQMVVAWPAPHTVNSHNCFQVHVAHAPFCGWNTLLQAQSPALYSALELGIFDISVASCASALAMFLEGQQHSLILGARTAQEECPIVRSALLRSDSDQWRIDQVEDIGIIDHPNLLHDRIYRWLHDSRFKPRPTRFSETSAMSGKPSPPSDLLSPPQNVRSRSQRTPSDNSLLTVPSYAEKDVRLNQLIKNYEKKYPLQYLTKIFPKHTASAAAKNAVKVLDPPTCVMLERYTSGVSWPPPHAIPTTWNGAEQFRPVYDELFRPIVFSVQGCSLGSLTHVPLRLEPATGEGQSTIEESVGRSAPMRHHYVWRMMDKKTVEALVTLADQQVIEQALLCQIPDAWGPAPMAAETQDAFFASAHRVCEISVESADKRARGLELNEAETRISFDRLNGIVFSGHALDQEVVTDTIAEREVQNSRNDFLDADLRRRRPEDLDLQHLQRRRENDLPFSLGLNQLLVRRSAELRAQQTQLTDYALMRGRMSPPTAPSSSRESAHDWVTNNIARMIDTIQTELFARSQREERWKEATASPLHLEARALTTFDSSRIDAGSIFTVPDIFPKKDSKRVSAFSIVTSPVPTSEATQKGPSSGTPQARTAQAEDLGPSDSSSTKSKEKAHVVFPLEFAECVSRLHEKLSVNYTSNPGRDDSEAHDHTSAQSSPSDFTFSSDYLPLVILFLVWEFKKEGQSREQVTNQGRFALMNNVKFLACLGIYELPVFAIVAVGFKAYLLMAWGIQDPNQSDVTLVKIADENCPHWDICNRSQALHLAIFLLNLRDHWLPHLLEKVRGVTADVRARWSSDDPKVRHSFDWQMTHQLGEGRLRSLNDFIAEQMEQELPERRKVLERKDTLMKQQHDGKSEKKAKSEGKKAKAGTVHSSP